jgi:hypothetical protein
VFARRRRRRKSGDHSLLPAETGGLSAFFQCFLVDFSE